MNKPFNYVEKCFALFCKKNIPQWGTTEKCDLSQESLMLLQRQEWREYWQRMGSDVPDFTDKVVVDYGCGFGYDSLFALQKGARHVYCLEVSEARLKGAEELHASHGFKNVTYIDNTDVGELPKKIDAGVDIVFSRDVMEHVPSPREVLDSMYRVTNPGGEIYIGFSPFYRSPFGSHFKCRCGCPWIHLVFSEKTILNVFKELYGLSRSVNSYQEIEGSGVNRLSYFEYKEMIDGFAWERESDHTNRFPRRPPLTKTLNLLVKIMPFRSAKELFIINSYIRLRKSPAPNTSFVENEEVLTAGSSTV